MPFFCIAMTAHHATPETSRRLRLKAATHDIHDVLDRRIMAFNPFADRTHYADFLHTQFRLHRDVQVLFDDPNLNQLLPQLGQRSRLALVEQDLQDLGVVVPAQSLPPPAFTQGPAIDAATALGWLYAVEGSNIGAAFLLKFAAKLGLDASHGARHLAPHPDGRAANWRNFIEQLDEVSLTAEEESRAVAGAQAAFAQVLAYVEQYCSLPAQA